jgi:outer membrane protein assembly factor BamE (lipoprotein component of BamABCDE complex)
MNLPVVIISLALCCTGFAGCIPMSHEMVMGKKIDPAVWNLIVEGKTTEAEVIELLGKPDNKMLNADGTKTYMYSYSKTSMSGGGFLGSINTKTETEGETYMVSFNKKGIVTSLGQKALPKMN